MKMMKLRDLGMGEQQKKNPTSKTSCTRSPNCVVVALTSQGKGSLRASAMNNVKLWGLALQTMLYKMGIRQGMPPDTEDLNAHARPEKRPPLRQCTMEDV
jgi:hypothetical protein